MIRETIGWLEHEGDTYIRVVWERMLDPLVESNSKDTGLVILKSAILEFKTISCSAALERSERSAIYRDSRDH